MASQSDWNQFGADDSDEDYTNHHATRKSKRRRVTLKSRTKSRAIRDKSDDAPALRFSIAPLLEALHEQTTQERDDNSVVRGSFEEIFAPLLPGLLDAEVDLAYGDKVAGDGILRLLSFLGTRKLHESLKLDSEPSIVAFLLAAKARLHSRVLRRVVLNRIPTYLRPGPLTPLRSNRVPSTVNPEVLDALYAIQTTPYQNSFLSRIQGSQLSQQIGVIAVDWETQTPWMDLMSDIREHYSLSHPGGEQPQETLAPIIYCTLQRYHLEQVHDLLVRAFWEGINVSDSLDYSPEKCTIVATYKRLVVGAAFLSSPRETYITYLAVRSGWDNSQIATSMLYHLITLNPHKDITLHVSINNPAMLLYNRFGFKAEEFVVGFYEDYLDPNSPQSKNAFRLRLRR